MSLETNKLVGKAGRIGAPAGAAVALVLAGSLFFHHNGVHAAMISSPAPMDDNSVSALVSLDSAVEAVASRVSPAVVNIQVTSRGSSEHETGGEQDQSQQGHLKECLRVLPSSLDRAVPLAVRCSGRSNRRLSMALAAA